MSSSTTQDSYARIQAAENLPKMNQTSPQNLPQPQSQQSQSQWQQATQKQPNLYLENDPARTGFDPKTKWWINYFSILSGGVTPEGIFHYRESRSRLHEQRDVERAERFRDWLLNYSPTVTFLNDRIAQLNHGQKMDASNIICRRCPARLTVDGQVERQGGGFEPAHGILVCANEIRNRGHMEDIMSHEMVHAYDSLRWDVDFRGQRDLRQAACTEVCLPLIYIPVLLSQLDEVIDGLTNDFHYR